MLLARSLWLTTTSILWVHQLHSITTSLAKMSSDSQKVDDVNDQADGQFQYEAGSSSIAFVTTPDSNTAKKLAHGLVENKLAACVNIIPQIQSIYLWEGKINEDSEFLMLIKTKTNRIDELTKWVRDNHPYSVAEVITVPIEKGNPLYMKWLNESIPS